MARGDIFSDVKFSIGNSARAVMQPAAGVTAMIFMLFADKAVTSIHLTVSGDPAYLYVNFPGDTVNAVDYGISNLMSMVGQLKLHADNTEFWAIRNDSGATRGCGYSGVDTS